MFLRGQSCSKEINGCFQRHPDLTLVISLNQYSSKSLSIIECSPDICYYTLDVFNCFCSSYIWMTVTIIHPQSSSYYPSAISFFCGLWQHLSLSWLQTHNGSSLTVRSKAFSVSRQSKSANCSFPCVLSCSSSLKNKGEQFCVLTTCHIHHQEREGGG